MAMLFPFALTMAGGYRQARALRAGLAVTGHAGPPLHLALLPCLQQAPTEATHPRSAQERAERAFPYCPEEPLGR